MKKQVSSLNGKNADYSPWWIGCVLWNSMAQHVWVHENGIARLRWKTTWGAANLQASLGSPLGTNRKCERNHVIAVCVLANHPAHCKKKMECSEYLLKSFRQGEDFGTISPQEQCGLAGKHRKQLPQTQITELWYYSNRFGPVRTVYPFSEMAHRAPFSSDEVLTAAIGTHRCPLWILPLHPVVATLVKLKSKLIA